MKKIAEFDLERFKRPDIPGNRGVAMQIAWYFTNVIFFQSAIFGLLPNKAKAGVLRFFGARIGRGFVCKPRASIKYPWFLEVGDNVWIGEKVWIDNHCIVRIGSNCCISQGCYLGTGNHDWSDPAFAFYCEPIVLGDGVWITAFSRIMAGSTISSHCVWRPEAGRMT